MPLFLLPMLSWAKGIFTNPKILLAIAIAAVVAFGYYKYHSLETDDARKTALVVTLQTQLTQCQTVNKYNEDQVNKLQAQEQTDQAQFDALSKQLASTSAQQAQRVIQIIKQPIPKTCQASIDYLVNGAQTYKADAAAKATLPSTGATK